jgi:hypothetical protein
VINKGNCLWRQLLSLVTKWFGSKRPKEVIPEPLQPARRIVDTQAIRNRIAVQGWKLREIPIKRSNPDPAKRTIFQWKIIAAKGEKSIEVGGPTIDDAIKNIGKTLGVISKDT